VGPKAGLDDVEKRKSLTLAGLEPQFLARPACSQSLYRLRHAGSSPARSTETKLLLAILDEFGW
jgi:hypothetical protein